ncbi:MAG: hypothetical protein AAFN77_15390 [Planctomycetota bacterium]
MATRTTIFDSKRKTLAESTSFIPLLWPALVSPADLQANCEKTACLRLSRKRALENLERSRSFLIELFPDLPELGQAIEQLEQFLKERRGRIMILDLTDHVAMNSKHLRLALKVLVEAMADHDAKAKYSNRRKGTPELLAYVCSLNLRDPMSIEQLVGDLFEADVVSTRVAKRSSSRRKSQTSNAELILPDGWMMEQTKRQTVYRVRYECGTWQASSKCLATFLNDFFDVFEKVQTGSRPHCYCTFEPKLGEVKVNFGDMRPMRDKYPAKKRSRHQFIGELSLLAEEYHAVPEFKGKGFAYSAGIKKTAKQLRSVLRSLLAKKELRARLKSAGLSFHFLTKAPHFYASVETLR